VTSPTTGFAVAAAQSASARGDVEANVRGHLRFIEAAASAGVKLVVFPELSLTGYEMDLAQELALEADDAVLEPLRRAVRRHAIHAIVGAPRVSGGDRPYLGAFVVSPSGTTGYAKIHVHESELPFFRPGSERLVTSVGGVSTGLAICADTSHPEHAADAAARGAKLYVASVLKAGEGYPAHARRLEQYAARHGMAVLTANYAGDSGGWKSAGKSAVWDERGSLVARARSRGEALVIARHEAGGWRGEVVTDL